MRKLETPFSTVLIRGNSLVGEAPVASTARAAAPAGQLPLGPRIATWGVLGLAGFVVYMGFTRR